MRIRRALAAWLLVLCLQCGWIAVADAADQTALKNSVLEHIARTTPAPDVSPVGGEWAVLCLARGGYYETDAPYFAAYARRAAETVRQTVRPDGALHRAKSTENSRVILALTAIGADPQNVGGADLLQPYENTEWIGKQGINGFAFALLALDSKPYGETFSAIRRACVENLLNAQTADGGWALSCDAADPDMTAMVLQALANYAAEDAVAAAAARGFQALSAMQRRDGTFSDSCESAAQVVTACCAWQIDPDTDPRFVKAGGSAWSGLLSFYKPQTHAFFHGRGDRETDTMATEQAGYAIVAYDRFLNGQTALYDMSDVAAAAPVQPTTQQTTAMTAPTTDGAAPTTTTAAQTTASTVTTTPKTTPKTTEDNPQPTTAAAQTLPSAAAQSEPAAAAAATPATPNTGESGNLLAVAAAALLLSAVCCSGCLRKKREDRV